MSPKWISSRPSSSPLRPHSEYFIFTITLPHWGGCSFPAREGCGGRWGNWHSAGRASATCSLWPEWPQGFPIGTAVKTVPAHAGDAVDSGSIPGTERSPGVGNGNPPQYSCLESPMERRSLADYSPCGHKESDKTEHAHTSQTPMWNQTLQLSFGGFNYASALLIIIKQK